MRRRSSWPAAAPEPSGVRTSHWLGDLFRHRSGHQTHCKLKAHKFVFDMLNHFILGRMESTCGSWRKNCKPMPIMPL
eukprot:9480944-Pyramimonas_sp.AAC.1